MGPLHLAAIRADTLFQHLVVRDVDLGVPIDALDPRAELLALAAIPRGLQHRPEHLAQPAFRNLGAVLGPVGLDDAGLRIVDRDREARVGPEIDHLGKQLLGRPLDHQPAQVAVALDTHVRALRQHVGILAGAGLLLQALLLELRVGRGSGGRRLVARIVVGLGQVGWNAERVAAPRAL